VATLQTSERRSAGEPGCPTLRPMTVQPNVALRAARSALLMSQDELARAVRAAGHQAGEPNDCTKRLVQRWEAGEVVTPRGNYARALEAVTGMPITNLGFKPATEMHGHGLGVSRREALATAAAATTAIVPLAEGVDVVSTGALSGIWLSRYWYTSSSRGNQRFSSAHYCVVIHRGPRLQVRSLPNTQTGRMTMDLTAANGRATGTWREATNPEGYYQGSVYDGAIQMLIDPTGHRMTGKWIGWGRDFEVNTDEWTLKLVTADTSREAIEKHDRPVE
jgi:transcriptional regulator with XRE-family HTH domain